MMRLALAAAFIGAALLPAVTAAPTCTEDTCCVAKVMGMCKDNTHDTSGKAQGEAGYVAAGVDDIDCSGEATNTQNKGSEATGRTTALCCEAAPTPAPTYGCGDKIGDDATTADPVTDADCGAGWEADSVEVAADTSIDAAFAVGVEDAKVECCTICPVGKFATASGACEPHALLDCPAGKQPKYAAGDTADCADEAGCCEACATGKFSDADNANGCDIHSTCSAWEFITAGNATADATCTGHTITACPTAGFGPKATTLAGTAAADCTDEPGCCEACATGTWAAVANAVACAAHSTSCAAWEFITAGNATADATCTGHTITACPTAGFAPKATTLAGTAAADCTDEPGCCEAITGSCVGNVDGDDAGSDPDDYACPDDKYVPGPYVSPVTTEEVDEACIAVPAVGAFIVDAETTCTLADGACTVATGGGSCTYVAPVEEVGGDIGFCPEPPTVTEDSKTSGSAAAAPLAIAAALAAILA